MKELARISTNDTDVGRSAQEALQALRTSISNGATITVISSEGADVTKSVMLSGDQYDILNPANPENVDDDIIDAVKHQELSKQQEFYPGRGIDRDEAKSAVLVTDDRAMHLKASAYGVYSISPSVFRSLETDEG